VAHGLKYFIIHRYKNEKTFEVPFLKQKQI
jgi:hypothetical protein